MFETLVDRCINILPYNDADAEYLELVPHLAEQFYTQRQIICWTDLEIFRLCHFLMYINQVLRTYMFSDPGDIIPTFKGFVPISPRIRVLIDINIPLVYKLLHGCGGPIYDILRFANSSLGFPCL